MSKRITSQIILLLVGLLPMTSFAQLDDQPDLIISDLEVTRFDPISGTNNIAIRYEYQITNIGSTDISDDVNGIGVRVSISADQIQSTDDIIVNDPNIITGGIPPRETVTQTYNATIAFNPNTTPYLTMKVDGQDLVDETDEGNNFAWTHIIQPQEISLNEAVVNNQIIIQYSELTAVQIAQIQAIFLSFGGVVVDECNCERSIAVWEFDNPQDAQDVEEALEELEIFGGTADLEKKAEVDGNELIIVELRRPLIGFELESSGRLPQTRRDVLVYLIDTGVDTDNLPFSERAHLSNPAPVLCGNIESSGFNYQFPPNITGDFDDENGHGTFGYRAITKDVDNRIKVVPLKVFNKEGEGTLFGIICAIYHAIDNGADIINISAGYQGDKNSILEAAVKEAEDEGIFIVAAAGNDEKNVDTVPYYPAAFAKDHKNVISVASQNLGNDKLGKCSNYGKQSVTMSAPGEKICGYNHKGHRVILSGTSMAAFYVTRQLAVEIASRNRGDFNVGTARNKFLEKQKDNCLKNSTSSGRCLDVGSERCNIIFEWLVQVFAN